MIYFPAHPFLLIVFLESEEENKLTTLSDDRLLLKEVHLPQSMLRYLVILKALNIIPVNTECLSLPIENMNLFSLGFVEAILREVLRRSIMHAIWADPTFNTLILNIVYKVVVGKGGVMEESNEQVVTII